jgi:hypothetical protein
MHIIFGDSLHLIPEKFTILELDTFEDGDKQETAWCVVENIPLGDFPTLDAYKKVHSDLMQAYRGRNWEYCNSAIKGLRGRWNGELDSFYDNLQARVTDYERTPPLEDWNGCLTRSLSDL